MNLTKAKLFHFSKTMMFRKLVNHQQPTSLASKIESGVQLFGAVKSAWDVGKQVYQGAQVAAPYVARIASLL